MNPKENPSDPFVSVIVPVYNDPDGISQCLSALSRQTYPREEYEIIVVDNGSTDDTRRVVEEYPVQLLVEDEIQGSYAARNKGIQYADGEILAFIDADASPHSEWLESGVNKIVLDGADLAAGRIRFTFSPQRTPAERYDALVHMRNDSKVRDGVAATANLFVKSSAFEEVGLFPQQLRSGGDFYWTKSATEAGLELAYASEAIVDHPARNLMSLLKKMYRVGEGGIELRRLNGTVGGKELMLGLMRYPSKITRFLREQRGNGVNLTEEPPDRDVEMTIPVYLVGAISLSFLALGRIVGLIRAIVS